MSSNDDKTLESLGLSAEERARAIAEEQKRLRKLADEVASRYDPSRLGRASIAGAGTLERLDDATRRDMERRLGTNFAHVRVVRGAFADRVLKHHRADAVTLGATGLVLLRDTPRTNLKTTQGRALLAHELTHVRQAKAGMKFALEGGSSDNADHEREAEAEAQDVIDEGAGSNGAKSTLSDDEVFDELLDGVLRLLKEARRQDLELLGFDDR